MSDAEQDSVTISRKALDELRARASLVQVLVEDFVNDGHGDVHGPHLAEPEVWARLEELEHLEGTEPLTDEEVEALLDGTASVTEGATAIEFESVFISTLRAARAKLLAREDG